MHEQDDEIDENEHDYFSDLTATLEHYPLPGSISAKEFTDIDFNFELETHHLDDSEVSISISINKNASQSLVLFNESESKSDEEEALIPNCNQISEMLCKLSQYAIHREPILLESVDTLQRAYDDAAFLRLSNLPHSSITDFFN